MFTQRTRALSKEKRDTKRKAERRKIRIIRWKELREEAEGMSGSLWAPIHHRKKSTVVPSFTFLFALEDSADPLYDRLSWIPLSRSTSCDSRPSNYLVFDMSTHCKSFAESFCWRHKTRHSLSTEIVVIRVLLFATFWWCWIRCLIMIRQPAVYYMLYTSVKEFRIYLTQV